MSLKQMVLTKPPTSSSPSNDHLPSDQLITYHQSPPIKQPPTNCTDHWLTDQRSIKKLKTRDISNLQFTQNIILSGLKQKTQNICILFNVLIEILWEIFLLIYNYFKLLIFSSFSKYSNAKACYKEQIRLVYYWLKKTLTKTY